MSFLINIGSKEVKEHLSQFLYDYRTLVHTTTNECPAKLLLGRMPRIRFDILKSNVRKTVFMNQEKQGKDRHVVRKF